MKCHAQKIAWKSDKSIVSFLSQLKHRLLLKAMSAKQVVSHPGRKLALAQDVVSLEEDIRGIDVWHLT